MYQNPLRAIAGLVPERIDQGVDFSGAGPVYPIGDAVITNAQGDNYGWPDGGWLTYRPAVGLTVYVTDDVKPVVAVGQVVTPDTVIADMYQANAGIETGWAMATGFTAESQAPEVGGISGPARSRPRSGSTSTNCSRRWEFRPPTTGTTRQDSCLPATRRTGPPPSGKRG